MSRELHWYEDYWKMPRNLPRGQSFFIGHYQTQRALRYGVKCIHTDQDSALSTSLFEQGYGVFLHFASGKVKEITLGADRETGHDLHSGENLMELVLSGVFGELSD